MIELLYDILRETVNLWLAMAPYILLGLLIAGVLHAFLGENFITRHLGGGGLGSIVKATSFGIPLPICSCGVIPVAASLKKEGASKSSVLSFLVSTPTTGVDSILATYSLLGPLFAVFRPLAAFISGISIGIFNRIFNREGERAAKPQHTHEALKPSFRVKEVFHYGFVELAAEIGKWLVAGVAIGGVLTVAIPESLITRSISQPALHFLIMLILAVPLYVCATGSIPIATALIAKGFSPGAALVFLIAGPATNTVTLSFVYSKLGKRAFYVYLISIITISLLMGWLFNLIWTELGSDVSLVSPHGQFLSPLLSAVSGIILLLVIARGFLPSNRQPLNAKYQLHVPEMNCKHCKMTVENALKDVQGVDEVKIDLDSRMVGINGEASRASVTRAIENAGYAVKNGEE